jgi:hypothetical protein
VSNVILEQSEKELTAQPFFDIGIIDQVVKKPISEIDDEIQRKYQLESQYENVNLYNVKLVSRTGYLEEIPMLYQKNVICPPAGPDGEHNIGDQVLVAYLKSHSYPFILQTLTYDFVGARRGLRIPFEIDEDEHYITANKANFIHWRKDGAIVMRGSNVFEKQGLSSCYMILGGEQGKSLTSENRIMFSFGIDQLGTILQADDMGNVFLNAQKKMNFNMPELAQMVTNMLNIFIGQETEKDDMRAGVYNLKAGKKITTYAGETVDHIVGDVNKTDNRHDATYSNKIAKKYTLQVGKEATLTIEMIEEDGKTELKLNTVGCEIKIDDVAKKITIDRGSNGKIYIDESGVRIGADGATQPLVLGWKLENWLSMHTHTTTSPGAPTSPPIQGASLQQILSQDHKIKK